MCECVSVRACGVCMSVMCACYIMESGLLTVYKGLPYNQQIQITFIRIISPINTRHRKELYFQAYQIECIVIF